MGADRYSQCPKCQENFQLALRVHETEIEAAYGKVPVAEYEALKAKIPTVPGETLGSIWGFWLALPATFGADYDCSCEVCGFKFRFHHTEQMKW